MPALNFTVFVDKVESGEKPTTIRRRTQPGRHTVGCNEFLFTGMRTKSCRRLRTPYDIILPDGRPCVVCKSITPLVRVAPLKWMLLGVFGVISVEQMEEIAVTDGFSRFAEMDKWFERYERGAELELIRWGDSP